MTPSPVEFASLLCSRLCHDLLSPVGALNNGLELLADETDPAMRERCMELLTESARTSANKLKFFRLAFGAGGGFGENIDVREAKTAIEGLVSDNKRIELNWIVEAEALPKAAVKAMLNIVLIASEALVRGGSLSVGAEENGGQVEIVAQLEASRILLDPDIRRVLVEGPGDVPVTPRTSAAYMVNSIARDAGGAVQVSEPTSGVMILGTVFNAR
jgi:histidine phosphotransferase ChpT